MIKIYWYSYIKDYVFEGLYNDKRLWACGNGGKVWYSQFKNEKFELMGEM